MTCQSLSGLLLGFIVLERGLDSVFCQHGAVEFDRGQTQVRGYIGVLYLSGLLQTHALEDLSGVGARGDGRPTSEGLEHGLLNCSIFLIHLNLEFHDVSAGGRAHQSRADRGVLFVEGADVAGVVVVVQHVLVVGELSDLLGVKAVLDGLHLVSSEKRSTFL